MRLSVSDPDRSDFARHRLIHELVENGGDGRIQDERHQKQESEDANDAQSACV